MPLQRRDDREGAHTGTYRAEHLFALEQALALYDAYREKASACDARIEAVLKDLSIDRGRGHGSAPRASRRRNRTDQANALTFDVREALFALLGKDITTIDRLGPYLSLKLIAECGDDLSSWPSAKHFTSWLGLAPSNKISGGKMLSSRTRRSGGRAAALLRLAAVTVGRTDTADPDALQRLDDLSSIPCPWPCQPADEVILLCFGIWIGGVLDKRDRQVRQIGKRVRQLTDRLCGECDRGGRRGRRGGNWIGGRLLSGG